MVVAARNRKIGDINYDNDQVSNNVHNDHNDINNNDSVGARNRTHTHLEGLLDGLDVVWQRRLLERDIERPELAALARELLLRGEAPHGLRHIGVFLDH